MIQLRLNPSLPLPLSLWWDGRVHVPTTPHEGRLHGLVTRQETRVHLRVISYSAGSSPAGIMAAMRRQGSITGAHR